MEGQTVGEKRCGKVRGRETAKGFVLVLLAENRGGNPNLHFSPLKNIILDESCGKKTLAKNRIKTACGEKRVTVEKREQCRGSSRRRFPEVSGGYEGIKERFCELEGLTAVLKCIINRLDCRARKDKMPTLASGRVSLGCYELISAMLVR